MRNVRSNWQIDKLTAPPPTHLIWPWAEDEQVKGDGGHHVYEEPAFKVVDGDLGRVAHHLLVDVDVSGPEVDEDVHDEHDVHNQVHHVQRRAGVAALPPPLLLEVVEEEGGGVGRENGRVDDEQQDEPVPHGFEGAVVEDGPPVDACRLELVLGENVCAQRQNLRRRRTENLPKQKIRTNQTQSLKEDVMWMYEMNYNCTCCPYSTVLMHVQITHQINHSGGWRMKNLLLA